MTPAKKQTRKVKIPLDGIAFVTPKSGERLTFMGPRGFTGVPKAMRQ